MPGSEASPLLFRKLSGTSDGILSAFAHLDIERDSLVVNFGIALDNHEVVLVFASTGIVEIAAFELGFVETVEEGKWDIIVLFVLEFPVYPLFVLNLKVLKHAEVNVHELC